MNRLLAAILIIPFLCSINLYANEPSSIYRIGGAVLWHSEVYQDDGNETRVFPALYLKSGDWEFKYKELKYYIVDTEQFKLAPVLSLDLGGYDANDSPALAGMADRDLFVGLGIAAKMEWKLFDIGASVRHDIANNSDGIIADFSVGLSEKITERLFGGIETGVTYQDSDYSNYYYGVLPNESTLRRAAYEPGSTINPYIQLNAFYYLNKHWVLNSAVIYSQFDSAIEDSPIVGSGNETTILLGISYQGFF